MVLGVVIAAAVARSGRASLDQPRRMTDEPRSAIEIDGSVAPIATAAPSFVRDASMPLAMPAPRVDARTAPPRSNVDPDSPPVTRHLLDGGAQESEPTVVVEPEPKPATEDTMTVDASVEPDTVKIEPAPGDAAVEVDVAVTPAKTAPSFHRTPPPPTAKKPPLRDGTPPVPAARKPPDRDVIVDPFNKRKKQITK